MWEFGNSFVRYPQEGIDNNCTKFCANLRRHLTQLVERAPHVLSLCSGPRFDSRPGSLCCVSLPLSRSLFPVKLIYQ